MYFAPDPNNPSLNAFHGAGYGKGFPMPPAFQGQPTNQSVPPLQGLQGRQPTIGNMPRQVFFTPLANNPQPQGMFGRARNAFSNAFNASNAQAGNMAGKAKGWGGKAKTAGIVLGAGAGLLAASRTLGSGILDASTDEYDELAVRSNPVGGFIFGKPDQSPEGIALRNMRMSREMGLAEQERLTRAYQDNAKFNQELALKNAMERAPLEYGWGSANTYQATNADLLANSVNNYLSAMGRSNQAMQMILGRGNSLLGGQ